MADNPTVYPVRRSSEYFILSLIAASYLLWMMGGQQIINVTVGCYMLRKFQNSRSWIAIGSFVPSIIGAVLLITLPFSNKASFSIEVSDRLSIDRWSSFTYRMAFLSPTTSSVSTHVRLIWT